MATLAALELFAACGGESTGKKTAPAQEDCESNADCVVVPQSCCGTCGSATRDDAIAVKVERSDEYRADACETAGRCPACAAVVEDPRLLGVCVARRCEVVRLHDHPVAYCASDAECQIRTRDCCPCGGETAPGRMIAIRKDGESYYSDIVCDEGQACPECAPVYPAEVTARCGSNAYCEASDTRLP